MKKFLLFSLIFFFISIVGGFAQAQIDIEIQSLIKSINIQKNKLYLLNKNLSDSLLNQRQMIDSIAQVVQTLNAKIDEKTDSLIAIDSYVRSIKQDIKYVEQSINKKIIYLLILLLGVTAVLLAILLLLNIKSSKKNQILNAHIGEIRDTFNKKISETSEIFNNQLKDT